MSMVSFAKFGSSSVQSSEDLNFSWLLLNLPLQRSCPIKCSPRLVCGFSLFYFFFLRVLFAFWHQHWMMAWNFIFSVSILACFNFLWLALHDGGVVSVSGCVMVAFR